VAGGARTVGLVVASEAALADVGAMIESIPAPDPALGEHPTPRLAGRSDEGSDVLWAVELADYLPSDGPPAVDERPCVSLWVDGQVVGPTCGVEVPPPSAVVPFSVFGPVAHVDGDATVVFGLLSPRGHHGHHRPHLRGGAVGGHPAGRSRRS
jgi:hypothetical protein